jgi:hypothetical protein
MKVCVVITVAMAMLLRNFGPHGILFMSVCNALDFPVILDGKFTSFKIISENVSQIRIVKYLNCAID